MAEQYASFQGKEPNIDVNLFVNAITAGIAQGNAQKNTAQSIFEGTDKGIKNAIGTFSSIQGAQSQYATNQVQSTPEGIANRQAILQAQADSAQAGAEVAQNQAATSSATQATDLATAVVKSQTANDQAQIVLQDTQALSGLVKLGTAGDVNASLAALGNPANQQALSRNPVFGQQFVTTLRQQGGDPAVLDVYQKQYENLAYQAQTVKAKDRLSTLGAKAAADDAHLAAQFDNRLNTTPEFDPYKSKENFDYRLLDIRPSKAQTAQHTPIGYDITYGDQIIQPNAFTKEDVKDGRKQLASWKANNYVASGNPPPGYGKPATPQGGGALGVEGLHSLKPSTPTIVNDNAPTAPAAPARSSFLEGAIKLGGFSSTIVDNNPKVFGELGATISNIVKNGDIRSEAAKSILDESVHHTARVVSDYLFDTSPAIKASNTQVQIDQHNSSILGRIKSLGNLFDSNFAQPFLVKTPQELYFYNNGTPIVKQVAEFTNKAIRAQTQSMQLQSAKARSNAGQQSLLQSIASGNP